MQSARLKFLVGVALACAVAVACQQASAPSGGAGGSGDTGGSGGSGSGGKGGTVAGSSGQAGTIGGAGGTGGSGGSGGTGGNGGLAAPDASGARPEAAPDMAAQPVDGAAAADATSTAPPSDAGPANPAGAVVWAIDNLQTIGGHRATVLGAPTIIDTPEGKALQFDGQDDALFVDNHPLARLSQFTVEIFFRPDVGGSQAQRWFHMQDDGSASKVLFETRLFGNSFVVDVFVESPGGEIALYAPQNRHPLGAWYHVAAVIDGQRARHYVNGVQEMDAPLAFRPHGDGRTSIGVRITRMYYFKGAIRLARFTPRALTPDQFLKPPAP